ncbi:MAG TPA: hypothetical protein DCE44_17490, partial [Verrucomicrobiales bacterium]|nr:hypothetical protein [Verrucomicrobiales bacterium]
MSTLAPKPDLVAPPSAVAKGLEGIVAAHSRLSDVRGDIGQLIYCGYDINELAGKVSYEEVVYLLHHNHLPNAKELAELKTVLAGYRELPQGVIDLLVKLPADCPPMHAIRTGVSALGCYDTVADDDTMDAQRRKALRLIAQIPVVTAYFHRARQGKPLVHPDASLGEAANFLYMIDREKPSEEKVNTMDMCYVLHADHGMNASTFAARVVTSTGSDAVSAIVAAIGALKGPLHGGPPARGPTCAPPLARPPAPPPGTARASPPAARSLALAPRSPPPHPPRP